MTQQMLSRRFVSSLLVERPTILILVGVRHLRSHSGSDYVKLIIEAVAITNERLHQKDSYSYIIKGLGNAAEFYFRVRNNGIVGKEH